MTINEAIEYLDDMKVKIKIPKAAVQARKNNEALDMAIKALEQEPTSFQWCTDCKEYDQEKHCCHRWSKVIRNTVEEMKQQPCEDAISREQAIKTAIEAADDWDGGYNLTRADIIEKAIKTLPSVTPQPKMGHWIEQIDHEENCRTLICSNCDRPALHDGDSIWKHKFCPYCGARMIEPQERSEKINCKSTKCENCVNHNYCDYEPQESEETDADIPAQVAFKRQESHSEQ